MQRQWSICAFLSAVDVCSLGIVPKSLIYKLMTDEEKKNVKKYLDKKQPGGFSMWKSGEKYFSEYYIWWKSSQFSFLPFPFEIENIHRMLASSHFSHPLHIFALPLSLSLCLIALSLRPHGQKRSWRTKKLLTFQTMLQLLLDDAQNTY